EPGKRTTEAPRTRRKQYRVILRAPGPAKRWIILGSLSVHFLCILCASLVRFSYHGISIIDTIWMARRSMLSFSAVVIDCPTSSMKLAVDCTRTVGGGGGSAPGAGGGGGGGTGAPGAGRGLERKSPVFRFFQYTSAARTVCASRTS